MKKIILTLIAVCALSLENTNLKADEMNRKIIVTIGEKSFEANLTDNETVKEFIKILPLAIDMKEFGAKEKFAKLNRKFPHNASAPGKINAGDLMIYDSDTLVLFYKSFEENFYKYAKIGAIGETSELLDALKEDVVKVKFELKD